MPEDYIHQSRVVSCVNFNHHINHLNFFVTHQICSLIVFMLNQPHHVHCVSLYVNPTLAHKTRLYVNFSHPVDQCTIIINEIKEKTRMLMNREGGGVAIFLKKNCLSRSLISLASPPLTLISFQHLCYYDFILVFVIFLWLCSCWLTPEQGTRWAFVGPTLAIQLVSTIQLCLMRVSN